MEFYSYYDIVLKIKNCFYIYWVVIDNYFMIWLNLLLLCKSFRLILRVYIESSLILFFDSLRLIDVYNINCKDLNF